jgi:diguanylate cyclase (GGDEF)-like protein
LNLDQFADSAYVRELRRAAPRMRFEPALELDYAQWHLQRVRLRLKVWFSLSALLCIFFTVRFWSPAAVGSAPMMLDTVGLLPCCLVLAWLPWSRHYRRFYLSAGWALGTGFYVLVAVLGVFGLLQGAGEQLALLTLNVLAVFFFSGLMFRHASLTAALTLVAFALAALALGLPYPMLLRSMLILMLTGLIGAIVYRDIECSYRRNFLENALLGELITRDPLCGLMNRRAFDEHLSRVWQSALRDQRALAVLMIDIDLFKHYNDLRGHQAGDTALCSVARVIGDCARRPLDMASRYGGEEFAIILYDVTLEHARDTAERLRQAVRNQHLKLEDIRQPGATEVTVSVGAAVVTPAPGRTPQGAVQLADEALYEAKRAGRNRVVVKGPDDYELLDTGSFRMATR